MSNVGTLSLLLQAHSPDAGSSDRRMSSRAANGTQWLTTPSLFVCSHQYVIAHRRIWSRRSSSPRLCLFCCRLGIFWSEEFYWHTVCTNWYTEMCTWPFREVPEGYRVFSRTIRYDSEGHLPMVYHFYTAEEKLIDNFRRYALQKTTHPWSSLFQACTRYPSEPNSSGARIVQYIIPIDAVCTSRVGQDNKLV